MASDDLNAAVGEVDKVAHSMVTDYLPTSSPRAIESCLPKMPAEVLEHHRQEYSHPIRIDSKELDLSALPSTVLYLAYGSNLCKTTFEGRRGIKPLSQLNVVAPDLVLTFNLCGIPYIEPCFANVRYHDELAQETTALVRTGSGWDKGLVGVVYEVTREDFAIIIATEGGGASYQDVLVDCYPLDDKENVVPTNPTSQPIKAHTLLSPPGKGRGGRSDNMEAEPSARYLKLIKDGADEHKIPADYRKYLEQIQPYTRTTIGQQIGRVLFVAVWFPAFSIIMMLAKVFRDKDGRSPPIILKLLEIVFGAAWFTYDNFFYWVFGDGEKTIRK
jgi:hypothetical protein